ncbi:MAG: hypothetical protein ACR2GL_06230 [Thermoleophilaceae bacterium]
MIGAVLALAAFYATMGARGAGDEAAPAPAPTAEKESSAPKTPGSRKPKRAGSGASKEETRALAPAAQPPAGKAEASAKAETKPKVAAPTGVPPGVARALARRQTVVLFFYQRGAAADDAAAARAVSSVRGRRGVAVFSAPISRLADYRGVTGGVGVSQAPAIVILDRDRKARLIEGFVDRETLAQEVADSR